MFKPVGKHEVSKVWDFVEPGICKILEKCGTETFTPRDIFRHLTLGHAALFVRDEGFVVLETCTEVLSGEPYLNVWLMWFKPGEAEKLEEQLIAWLDQVRDHFNCFWWQFSSPREGWGRAMDKHCKKHVTTWRRHK